MECLHVSFSRSKLDSLPGVMAFESQDFLFFASSDTVCPMASNSLIASLRSSSLSAASCAALNRRERCWFIFALGATPSCPSVSASRYASQLAVRQVTHQ